MDTTIGSGQRSGLQRTMGVTASLGVLGRILDWLRGLIYLTAEEKEEAGIYLGDSR